jgi:predicted dienelactone hydrolase
MKFYFVLTAAFFVCCASVPSNGVAVGTFTYALTDTARHRDVTAEIWFEADSTSNVAAFSARPPIKAIPIALNSTPKDSTTARPVIFISHGNWGTRYSQGWLALELVKAGYVVVSLSHPGTTADNRTTEGATRLWDRAKDASFVLDALLADAAWSKIMNAQKIGFIGHSFGAHTGVLLAGGTFDPEKQAQFCRENQHDFYCSGSAKIDFSTVDTKDAKQNYADVRFKVFYLMAAGPAQGFSLESLEKIQVPVAVDVAHFDDILLASENAEVFATSIKGAKKIERHVGHFTYVPECKPLLGKVLAAQICNDPAGVDRQKSHDEISREVVSFLATALLQSPLAVHP